MLPYYYDGVAPLNQQFVWVYYYKIILFYSLAMSLVLSFINEMNKKFGPGVLIPMMLGRYRNPREEERIFMFMD